MSIAEVWMVAGSAAVLTECDPPFKALGKATAPPNTLIPAKDIASVALFRNPKYQVPGVKLEVAENVDILAHALIVALRVSSTDPELVRENVEPVSE
jgi:hypothetical protein